MATINLGNIKFNWKGAYAGGTAYVVDDVVSYSGSTYVCKLASTGNLPTNGTYWDVMAQKGTDGTDVGTTLTTQGDILYRDGSGLQRLSKGTATQILQINSGATAPEWVDKPQGISQTDQWRFTTNSTSQQDPFGASNFERVDDATFAKIGTGMTNNSGIFTFPVTGLWLCTFTWDMDSSNTGGHMNCYVSTDSGSNYDLRTRQHTGDGQGWYVGSHMPTYVNVTNASTFRIKWTKTSSSNLYGNTDYNQSFVTFVRLADSQ